MLARGSFLLRSAATRAPRVCSVPALATQRSLVAPTMLPQRAFLRSTSTLLSTPTNIPQFADIANFVHIEELTAGNGKAPRVGSTVSVHYTGRFPNGKVFDSSVSRGQPLEFKLGAGQVIRGWDEVVKRMTIGQKVVATIKPDWAYGPRGAGGVIPPNATLVFEMELIGSR